MFNKCQIFTPEEYANKMLSIIGYSGKEILERKILENSCGNGQVLKIITEKLIIEIIRDGRSNAEAKEILQKNIIGFEIDKKIYEQCIDNLNDIAKLYEIEGVEWNVYNEDYLKKDLDFKVDYIVGNPPYITYQDLDEKTRRYVRENFYSCSKGKFDYCYPFIEKSVNDLNDSNGKMAYLVPSSIFKNVFGENLRDLILSSLVEIYDYKKIKIFENALVSASIINLDMRKIDQEYVVYNDIADDKKTCVKKKFLKGKWNFFEPKKLKCSVKSFKDYFKVSNSVATLLNEAFVINDYTILDDKYICSKGKLIEIAATREAASPRGKSYNINELIIFPYFYENSVLKSYSEGEFHERFPHAFSYLENYKQKLEKRKSDRKAKWFEYGRSQALKYLNQDKLLISSVVTDEVKIYNLSKDVIPYSGFYIVPIGDLSLHDARKILETPNFYDYLQMRGISANGKSLRFSVNDFLHYPLSN